MGVGKVSNSKNMTFNVGYGAIHRLHRISYYTFIATMSLSCTASDILSLIYHNLNEVTWLWTHPFWE